MSTLLTIQPSPLAGEGPAKPGERGLFAANPSPTIASQWSPLSHKGRGLRKNLQ